MPPKKPRQGRLSFTPKSASTTPAGSANSKPSSSLSSRGRGAGGSFRGKQQKRRAPNASILNFFQKVPNHKDGDGLFMEGEYEDDIGGGGGGGGDEGLYEDYEEEEEGSRDGNEFESEEMVGLFTEEKSAEVMPAQNLHSSSTPIRQNKKPVKGPFTIDEDDDSDDDRNSPSKPIHIQSSPLPVDSTKQSATTSLPPPEERPLKRKLPFSIDQDDENSDDEEKKPVPANIQPNNIQEDKFKDEDLFGDGDEDDLAMGGDTFEKREERRYLEMLQEEEKSLLIKEETITTNDDSVSCPICGMNLASLMEDEANRHVNRCLDDEGSAFQNTTAFGTSNSTATFTTPAMEASSSSASPFPPATSIPSSSKITTKQSAFAQIMTSHSEQAAWSAASAAESAARGKPASQRTCPFYKIMFNGAVSMDAFKYGKIPNVAAYFLSHFHSDHYGGLTASWTHGLIWCTRVTANLVRQKLGVDPRWVREMEFEKENFVDGGVKLGEGNCKTGGGEGLWVTAIPANHCPGSAIFVFERRGVGGKCLEKVLHCGDFRAAPWMLKHRLLAPSVEYVDEDDGRMKRRSQWIDTIYLDTTYLNPKYAFPSQKDVIGACSELCVGLNNGDSSWTMGGKIREGKGSMGQMVVKKEDNELSPHKKKQERLLVVVGTYSIGKERICMGIARALDSKIYAPNNKLKICACLEDDELNARLTSNPLEAQIHMTPLMEIRAETLADYLVPYKPHFTRIIGFRPSGWSYKPPSSRLTTGTSATVSTILRSSTWHSPYTAHDLTPARGSSREVACYGVPYSEHSSFRELTMFVCGLNVRKVVPTVNVGSAKSREAMGVWMERWEGEKRAKGLFVWEEEGSGGCGGGKMGEWGGL